MFHLGASARTLINHRFWRWQQLDAPDAETSRTNVIINNQKTLIKHPVWRNNRSVYSLLLRWDRFSRLKPNYLYWWKPDYFFLNYWTRLDEN